ncbi:hypothetical protein DSL72_001483 [Monilinia vaccinii-corymbosi]|uniref:Cytochrome P450 n=1 Tax=Monilinia vaccinii-corymbosi TaxID=61207 RepID=A0A8A3P613_9HELO|nr:hypothetical protein DSL72_001483 [Monilinia vaccinii-corymbosi]
MDILSKIVFGKELGCIQDPIFKNHFIEYLHSTFDMGWTATSFLNLTKFSLSLSEWLSEVLFPIPLMKFKKKCIVLIDDYFQSRKIPTACEAGRVLEKEEYNKFVVIDTFVDPKSAKDYSVLNASQLAEEVIMLLSAGNDTTSDSMMVGIYQILKSPKIYQKLNIELATSFPSLEEEITYDKAKKLVYLGAVIKETLCYSNPLPGRAPRMVPSEGYTLHGHVLPSGTAINTSSYLLNRHANVWSNPDDFLPESWLEKDAASLEKYMTSFYRGTRQCLSKE